MRIMLLAAAAALSFGIGSAYADTERVDLGPVQKTQPVVPAAKGRRRDWIWILLY
jgi:hypothetical protein